MSRSFIFLLLFLPTAYAQGRKEAKGVSDSSISDIFPLSVGNQWTYNYYYYYGNSPGPITDYKDTGSVTIQIIAKRVTIDSTVWVFQQNGSMWSNTNFMGWMGPIEKIDTFEIIETNAGNHQLYRRGELSSIRTSVLPLVPNLVDTAKIFRYANVDSTGAKLTRSHEYPRVPSYSFTFKRNVGLTSVSVSSGLTGFPFWGTHHTLRGSIVTSIDIPSAKSSAESYRLNQNYPNPANPSTTISFTIPSRQFVTLKIYDVLGQEVATLVDDDVVAGVHSTQWKPAGVASGMYLYRLQAGTYSESRKLLLLK